MAESPPEKPELEASATGDSPEPKNECHLLTVPAEMRNHIYDLVFEIPGCLPIDILKAKSNAPRFGIVGVCRQIAQETAKYHQGLKAEYGKSEAKETRDDAMLTSSQYVIILIRLTPRPTLSPGVSLQRRNSLGFPRDPEAPCSCLPRDKLKLIIVSQWSTNTFFANIKLELSAKYTQANTRAIEACVALPQNEKIRHFEIRVFNCNGPSYTTWDVVGDGRVRITTGTKKWVGRPKTTFLDYVIDREGFKAMLASGDGLDVTRIVKTKVDPTARTADLYY